MKQVLFYADGSLNNFFTVVLNIFFEVLDLSNGMSLMDGEINHKCLITIFTTWSGVSLVSSNLFPTKMSCDMHDIGGFEHLRLMFNAMIIASMHGAL
ncbi:hypothetical protein DKX38_007799 [Salix brachista]|uniref:Uncharacterized protein n=1 Tax=Salix brachista TaxID=2182728 RepID=A0A5N5MNY0_9ROSI|nr:hypothetical protein DKX38_007799 [Salix brachista]